jgi:hypothetical protein
MYSNYYFARSLAVAEYLYYRRIYDYQQYTMWFMYGGDSAYVTHSVKWFLNTTYLD